MRTGCLWKVLAENFDAVEVLVLVAEEKDSRAEQKEEKKENNRLGGMERRGCLEETLYNIFIK